MSHDSTLRRITHWIGGAAEADGPWLPVTDPATGRPVAEVCLGDAKTVDRAVLAARDAGRDWAALPASRRSRILARFALLLRENARSVAEAVTSEHGKTLDDALGELERGIEAVEAAVAGPVRLKGELSEQTGTNIDTAMTLHPLGVCVGVTPFNFPAMVPLMQSSVALAAGNTFVVKPSEQDPGATVMIAEIAHRAGLPAGVLSVVQGDRSTVEALLDHPDVAAVAFIGSTPVARSVYARGAANGKRVQALGGAKNHLVVMPDANLSAAADALTSAAFGSAGQRCMAITTAVAVGDVGDTLVAALAERASAVTMASGTTPGAEMGPVISAVAQERIRGHVAGALAAGAEAVVDRSHEQPHGLPDGYFVGPTVLDRVTTAMDVYRHEVFGPVLCVLRVPTLDDAIALVEASPYGNGSAIFTADGHAARAFQRRVPTGMIGINIPIPVPVATYGFCGWKDSAFGDTGLNGASWSFYTRPKYVTSRWDPTVGGVDLGFRPD